MADNSPLIAAAAARKDEFYTQLTDIERELSYYQNHFKGKVVYCNCDDPTVSNFFKYFSLKFQDLGLKKLITTCYKNQERDLFSQHDVEQAISLEYDGFREGERIPNVDDIGVRYLQSDGDFRSEECIEILKRADVVVTNPPFSLFREYVAQLVKFGKKFLILGDQNAISYKEVFNLFEQEKIWLGIDNGGTKWFEVNENYDIRTKARKKVENGKKYFSMGRILWYTNIDHFKRHEELILYKKYTPEEYPKYDNYDAIEVAQYTDIPADYSGNMGVPITFLDKFNPDQFALVGIDRMLTKAQFGKQSRFILNGKEKFARIVIRHKGVSNGD